MALFGGDLTISECLTKFLLVDYIPVYLKYVWCSTAFGYVLFFIAVLFFVNKKVVAVFIAMHTATYVILIYHHALPIFLLMLIYPSMTVTIFAYLITFTFVSIIFFSICLLVLRKLFILVKPKKMRLCTVISYSSLFLVYGTVIVLSLLLLLQLVYAIALSQSSSITAGPVHTVLSLIPLLSLLSPGC